MERKLSFEMKMSHDEDTEFVVYGNVNNNEIQFFDINNVDNRFIIDNGTVILKRGVGQQVFIQGEKTSTKYNYAEGLTLDIDTYTEEINYDGNKLVIKFENYINGDFTNKHELTLRVLN